MKIQPNSNCDSFYARTSKQWMAVILLVLAGCTCRSPLWAQWRPADSPLSTKWSADVDPENAWPEYPRPQMTRDNWVNLNGLWQYAITESQSSEPRNWDGQILVPFCIESALSGVGRRLNPEQSLWYRREFQSPTLRNGERLLLHFGAVDWHARLWINGREVGEHRGGYDPFEFDITEVLADAATQSIVVKVLDPTDTGLQPRGKQMLKPEGIWYTPVSGIWQTVWMEVVPESYIKSLQIIPDVPASKVNVIVETVGRDNDLNLELFDGGQSIVSVAGSPGIPISIPVANAKLWSPDSPHLYGLSLTLGGGDIVRSYVGMRSIEVQPDSHGVNRLLLNGKPVFQFGPLDQGWWPDGLYTAPTDEALRFDIEMTKRYGFNMIRKHVKVEPARWYQHCDQIGVLVWQDMPSTSGTTPWIRDVNKLGPHFSRPAESTRQLREELSELVRDFGNQPSIVMWVLFNESWGQSDTEETAALIKDLDPVRPVNAASGGNYRNVGDVLDVHSYPDPTFPRRDEKMAVVCGEFGGLGLPLAGHTWQSERNWGYQSFENQADLNQAYEMRVQMLRPLIAQGLAAAVYTQTTDVEIEVNGLMTYDRAIMKIDPERASAAASELYGPPPVLTQILDSARTGACQWRFTTNSPTENWEQADFDDSDWQVGQGGFGIRETPGAIVGTIWDGNEIWVRRTFELSEIPANPLLEIHHDEDADIYLNGVPAARLDGYTTDYVFWPIESTAVKSLRLGKNVIAIRCRQTRGGQFIDAGLVDVSRPRK